MANFTKQAIKASFMKLLNQKPLHEPPRRPRFIKTVWGVGYQIEDN